MLNIVCCSTFLKAVYNAIFFILIFTLLLDEDTINAPSADTALRLKKKEKFYL